MEELYKGFTIKIEQDEDAENPRDWDNAGTLCLSMNRYNLPNEGNIPFKQLDSWQEVKSWIEENEPDIYILLAVRCYEHSGLAFSIVNQYPFNDRWDSGQAGFIYITKKQAREEFGKLGAGTRKKCYNLLKQEVEIFSQYANGEVYGFIVKETGDSCWGFYGTDDALKAGQESVDVHIKATLDKHIKKLKKQIQSKVGLEYRKPLELKIA